MDSVRRAGVKRETRHGTRGESARLAENERFSVAVRTSMNLNENKRIEFYELSEGSPISDYLRHVTDYHFDLPAEDSYSAFTDFDMADLAKAAPVAQAVEPQARLGGWD